MNFLITPLYYFLLLHRIRRRITLRSLYIYIYSWNCKLSGHSRFLILSVRTTAPLVLSSTGILTPLLAKFLLSLQSLAEHLKGNVHISIQRSGNSILDFIMHFPLSLYHFPPLSRIFSLLKTIEAFRLHYKKFSLSFKFKGLQISSEIRKLGYEVSEYLLIK